MMARVGVVLGLALGPLAGLFALSRTPLGHHPGWDAVLGFPVVGVPLGFFYIGAGPVAAVVYVLRFESCRRYLRARVLASAILVAAFIALWAENPLFDFAGEDMLEMGGFSLWGRVLLSLIALATFQRLTRNAQDSSRGAAAAAE